MNGRLHLGHAFTISKAEVRIFLDFGGKSLQLLYTCLLYNLFMVMGCVFDISTVHKTVEKLTSQAFY